MRDRGVPPDNIVTASEDRCDRPSLAQRRILRQSMPSLKPARAGRLAGLSIKSWGRFKSRESACFGYRGPTCRTRAAVAPVLTRHES